MRNSRLKTQENWEVYARAEENLDKSNWFQLPWIHLPDEVFSQ